MELQKLQLMLHEAIEDDYEDYQIVVDRIECKIGNKVYNYPLLSWLVRLTNKNVVSQ